MKELSIIFCCAALHFHLCRHIIDAKSTVIPTQVPSRKASGVPSTASSLDDTASPTDFRSDTQSGGPKSRPNIMIIMADDVGIGDIIGKVDTPNIDKLAQQGMSFHNAHATPLCAPSRYSLLSGNYQHRGRRPGGTWTLDNNNNFKAEQLSLAKVLRDGGNYNTNVVGKWHLGAKIQPRGMQAPTKEILSSPLHNWTLPLLHGATSLGFDSSYITSKGIQGAPYTFFRNDFLVTKEVKNWVSGNHQMPHGTSKLRTGQGAPDWDSSAYNMILVNETEKFLDRHLAGPQKPFFSYVALGAVHLPHSPPDKYINGDLIAGQYPVPFLDMLLEMDKTVGSIVKILEDRHLINNTFIIFLSDNGGLQPEHGNATMFDHFSNAGLRGSKGEVYEGGHRIPLIMRQDGVIPAGQNPSALIGINDIFATVCEVAGVEIPKQPTAKDSISFAEFIKNGSSEEPPRQFLYVSRYKADKLIAEAGITETFKLIHFLPTRANQTTWIEFYNLDKDPMERDDLSNEQTVAFEIKKIQDQMNLINKQKRPTLYPTTSPTKVPSSEPTLSVKPSFLPTVSHGPSLEPSISLAPSVAPSNGPSLEPSISLAPSVAPSNGPSVDPSISPTREPTPTPTAYPTTYPTMSPTKAPSSNPTLICNFNNRKTCKRYDCVWKNSRGRNDTMCNPCTSLNARKCVNSGCILWPNGFCSSCNGLNKKNYCLEKHCVWRAREGCKACASFINKKPCIRFGCAWAYDSCVPCSTISRMNKCNSSESCAWVGERIGGKCGKVN